MAFTVALKHKLRFEPYTCYKDIEYLTAHLDTFARAATKAKPDKARHVLKKPNFFKATGEYFSISFAESNPRKALKKAGRLLGNLPLEILSYFGGFTDKLIANGQLKVSIY